MYAGGLCQVVERIFGTTLWIKSFVGHDEDTSVTGKQPNSAAGEDSNLIMQILGLLGLGQGHRWLRKGLPVIPDSAIVTHRR